VVLITSEREGEVKRYLTKVLRTGAEERAAAHQLEAPRPGSPAKLTRYWPPASPRNSLPRNKQEWHLLFYEISSLSASLQLVKEYLIALPLWVKEFYYASKGAAKISS